MGVELKEQWLNHTSTSKTTPHVEKVLRMRADREEGVSTTGSHKPLFEKPRQPKPQKKNKGMAAASHVASIPVGPPTVATTPTGPSIASVGAGSSISQQSTLP